MIQSWSTRQRPPSFPTRRPRQRLWDPVAVTPGTPSSQPSSPISPKDRFITVYGRNPVHEVLLDADLEVDKVVIADGARGSGLREIQQAARRRGVEVQHASAERVK